MSHEGVSVVSSGLISMRVAPSSLATSGRRAAGFTVPDVPTSSIQSQASACSRLASSTSSGMGSPNMTVSILITPPHCVQMGGRLSK